MGMQLLEILTVGLPFCGFKILAGLAFGGAPGFALIALGVADTTINLVNLAGLLATGRRPLAVCAFAMAADAVGGAPPAKRKEFGASLDVLLSFVLVALMIGFGRLGGLSARQLTAWNACVIFNVLGAGLGRFTASLQKLSRA